jgi:plastocyanin
MIGMRQTGRLLLAGCMSSVGLAAGGADAAAQSALERTPNLSAGWVGPAGQGHFHFIHRFNHAGAPARQVQNRPTFLLAYAPPWNVLAGVRYATRSSLAAGVPNEWELFLRHRPIRRPLGFPADLGLQVGYNAAARSADSELSVVRQAGRVTGVLAVRWLGRDADSGVGAASASLGAVLAIGSHVALSGDAGRRWTRGGGPGRSEPGKAAWGAGLALRLPGTPHTLSLHASNVDATTLHAASRAGDRVRWGFEFTVPITVARYLPGRSASSHGTQETGWAGAVPDTVISVRLANLRYEPARIEVPLGSVVVWHNEDPLEHTVTAEDGSWDSGPIPPGGVWRNRFVRPGRYTVICTPHPFMTAEVIVR